MVKHQVKVAVRTRPTANFASKNLQIDTQNNVRFPVLIIIKDYNCSSTKE